MECTLVYPGIEFDAASSAVEVPRESEATQPDSPDDGDVEEDWLDDEDSKQIQIAVTDSELNHGKSHRSFAVAAMVSVLSHLAFVALIAFVFARSGEAVRWRVARGDPVAQSGSLGSGIAQPNQAEADDTAKFEQKLAAFPPMTAKLKTAQMGAMDESIGESSALPDRIEPPTVVPPDVVIGIGAARLPVETPHFAAHQFKGGSNNNRAAPQYLLSGRTIPPSVAALSGGKAGERDGFDSRGLPIPDYPAESRRRGEEGTVVVDVEVLADGRVGTIHVVSDAGYPRLGAAAAEKLKLAAFEPARQDGKAVVGHLLIPYRFTLE